MFSDLGFQYFGLTLIIALTCGAVQHKVTLTMPGALPEADDAYLCSSFKVKDWIETDTVFINKFHVKTTAKKVHHMLIYACDSPPEKPGKIWNCMDHATCQGQSKLIYAWAKDAPPSKIPDYVGFKIGDPYKYIVLQMHYAHPLALPDHASVDITFTRQRPAYFGGIYVLIGWDTGSSGMQPHLPAIHLDVNCKVRNRKVPMNLFAFRTHTHKHGVVVTGYLKRGENLKEIARHNPQDPQMFYPMATELAVQNGDILAARCTMNTTSEDYPVYIGASSSDEMCNLYFMYYSKVDDGGFEACGDIEDKEIPDNLPFDSDKLLPGDSNKNLFLFNAMV